MVSLLEDRARWAQTLADSEAVWCAFCLWEIPDAARFEDVPFFPQSLEQHHPLPQSTFRDKVQAVLPKNFPVGWTIPAHKECHKTYYADGFSVASALNHVLETTDLAYRDRWAQQHHDAGAYWLAMIVNADTRKRFDSDLAPADHARLIERLLSSASGVRSSVRPVSFPDLAVIPEHAKTRVFNHLANHSANRGHAKVARKYFDAAQEARPMALRAESDLVALSSANRLAQVERTPANGRDAIAEARRVVGDNNYSYPGPAC